MNHDIVVAAEQRDGIVQKISFELIHGAAEVATDRRQGNYRYSGF